MWWVLILIFVLVVLALVAAAVEIAGVGSKISFPYIPAKILFKPANVRF